MLTGPEQLEWADALFKAFTYPEFSNLLLRLNDNVGNHAGPFKTVKETIGDAVGWYERRNSEDELIAAAIEWRPRNATLLRLASRKGVAAAPDDGYLQQLLVKTNSLLNFSAWLEEAGKIQVCVCRIEIDADGGGTIFGTGFLIAPELVMTNWHVVRSIVAKEDKDASYQGATANASDAICRFDHKVFANGLKSKGSIFTLAPDWRVALSPNNPSTREPENDELDCAVIKLQKPAGSLPVGDLTNSANAGDPRGFIKLPALTDSPPQFEFESPLFIVQHPADEPIKLALETKAIRKVTPGRIRVEYLTNSKPGSSGSPCFNENLKLVALHHGTDPNFVQGIPPAFNEGIPIDRIVAFLAKEGVISK